MVGALEEALKKACRLVKALRYMGTINKAEKEALWDAEDDVRRLTKAINRAYPKESIRNAKKSVAETRRLAEELQKAEKEAETRRQAEADKKARIRNNQIRLAAARRQANGPLTARFSSMEELCADLASRGRDEFVEDLAKNHGSAHDTSRPSYKIDNDGIIYAIICRANLKVYVGQTKNYDFRIRTHFSWKGGAPYIKKAIDKYGSKNFVSVILLAGIDKQDELDLAESAAIRYLDCLLGNRGYNKLDGRGESMFV
jgi:hypothetical protein